MSRRAEVHTALSALLAEASDKQLQDLLGTVDGRAGWGMTTLVHIEGHPVFVKMLPVTDLELQHRWSTRNLFDLPTYYNYGVGSAGFGVARELAAHLQTTEWVLSGAASNFPLLHHHRLLSISPKMRRRDPEQLNRYVAMWDGNKEIREFISARQLATQTLALFIEPIPYVLMDWLPKNQDRVGWVVDQAVEITAFLRHHRVAHFDANPSNVLTDGETLFFADFGLLLAASFELGPEETSFLARHRLFDLAEFIASLSFPLPNQSVEYGETYKQELSRFENLTNEMSVFFSDLQAGPKAAARYDDALVRQLLLDAGVPVEPDFSTVMGSP